MHDAPIRHTTPTPTHDPPGLFAPPNRRLTIALLLATALVAFESLSVVAALPELGRDLTHPDTVRFLPLVMTAYLLASGICIAITGPLADGLGPRRVYRLGVLLFAAASLACGFAESLAVLVPMRALQGAAGGMLISCIGAAVGLGFPNRLRSRAYAWTATVWGVLGVGGPALAGLLLQTMSWHWIFWVNVPLCLVALALGWSSLPGPAADARRQPLDPVGTTLLALVATTVVAGFSDWSPLSTALLALSLGLAWAFHRHATGRGDDGDRAPVLKRRHYAGMPFRALALAAALAIAAGVGVENYLPLYLREARGTSIVVASWSVFYLTVGWTTAANTMSRLYHRISEARTVLLGTSIVAVSLLGAGAAVATGSPLGWLYLAYFATGFGIGATTNACLTLVQAAALEAEIGRATSAHQFLRNMALTAGTALVGATVLLWNPELSEAGPAAEGVESAAVVLDPAAASLLSRGFLASHGLALVLALGAVAAGRSVDRHFRGASGPAAAPQDEPPLPEGAERIAG